MKVRRSGNWTVTLEWDRVHTTWRLGVARPGTKKEDPFDTFVLFKDQKKAEKVWGQINNDRDVKNLLGRIVPKDE